MYFVIISFYKLLNSVLSKLYVNDVLMRALDVVTLDVLSTQGRSESWKIKFYLCFRVMVKIRFRYGALPWVETYSPLLRALGSPSEF